ncbi:hypothetical protein BDQ17DRAFT_1347118 [Cyathus striatus]|nr:hypothetical protein BDQ17DRAFT_1347118 [Cyathus striatus]
MIQCPDGHLFCRGCIEQYVSTSVGDNNSKISCMHMDGCDLTFSLKELERCLPVKLMNTYQQILIQQNIIEAGIRNLEGCPFCEWKCIIDDEKEQLFVCGNKDGGCGKISCRKCKKPNHLPKLCKVIEKENALVRKHAIEEAMSQALMRNCPKCKKAFLKEDGCNKMKCPFCGTLSCYVCRSAINDTGYDHFTRTESDQSPTIKSIEGMCYLYDPIEKRAKDEVKAAEKTAREQYKKESLSMKIRRKRDLTEKPTFHWPKALTFLHKSRESAPETVRPQDVHVLVPRVDLKERPQPNDGNDDIFAIEMREPVVKVEQDVQDGREHVAVQQQRQRLALEELGYQGMPGATSYNLPPIIIPCPARRKFRVVEQWLLSNDIDLGLCWTYIIARPRQLELTFPFITLLIITAFLAVSNLF